MPFMNLSLRPLLNRTRQIRIFLYDESFCRFPKASAMLSSDEFQDLMSQVQAGEPAAAAELIRQFEPEIRLEVRVRLRVQDARVRRLLDSMDITQSVLASFFAGVAVGRYCPKHPRQLLGLLITMTRNKLLTQVRDQRRQRRDIRRVQSIGAAAHSVPAAGESPSQLVAGVELLGEFRRRLSDEERQLTERRGEGQTWTAIADELGGTPDARRKQLERAFLRIVRELNLDGSGLSTPHTDAHGVPE
jgi:RNA polymerase sigma-70 factor (ECF subfamily)